MREFCLRHSHGVISMSLFLLLGCFSIWGCVTPKAEKAPAAELLITGEGVEGRTVFTLKDLQSMEEGLVETDYFGINSYGTKGYTHFKGIGVWYLLNEKVKLKDDAARVTFIAEDGYEVEYSLEDVKSEDYIDEQNPEARLKMILAWEENGYEYDPGAGMPLQLTVGQLEPGDINKPYWVKNVVTIRVDCGGKPGGENYPLAD